MGLLFVLPLIAATAICWGVYGPVLHQGQNEMGQGSFRPLICVGMAYFLVAVVVPIVTLRSRGESGAWTAGGIAWSFVAGLFGSIGALGIILAFKCGGKPVYVMPLVFGCAPVVNTLVTVTISRTFRQASPFFLAGIFMVALGGAGVLFFGAFDEEIDIGNLTINQAVGVLGSIAVTAICWGAYGPVMHRGQMGMQGSRLRPFLCVGLAYFAVAVLVPILLLTFLPEQLLVDWNEVVAWTVGGISWSLLAGALGAVGALGIIVAFNFGGKPVLVMPLVFGGAPVVNTAMTLARFGSISQVPVMFFFSLILVVAGAITVLIFAPSEKSRRQEKQQLDTAESLTTAKS